jgi:hypothetical protein
MPETKIETITKAQMRKMWAMAKELGMDGVDLHGLVFNLTRKEHISQVTKAQAIIVIDYLVDRKKGDYRPEMASAQQMYKIRKLAGEMGWEDYRLKGFIRKYAGVENERWLDARRAYNIIEGLKKVKERRTKYKDADV